MDDAGQLARICSSRDVMWSVRMSHGHEYRIFNSNQHRMNPNPYRGEHHTISRMLFSAGIEQRTTVQTQYDIAGIVGRAKKGDARIVFIIVIYFLAMAPWEEPRNETLATVHYCHLFI